MEEKIPICLYNSGEKDKKAIKEIIEAKINCTFYGAISDEETPIIYYKSMEFYGVSGARAFIRKWQEELKKEEE